MNTAPAWKQVLDRGSCCLRSSRARSRTGHLVRCPPRRSSRTDQCCRGLRCRSPRRRGRGAGERLGVLGRGCGFRGLDDAACDGLVGLSPSPTRANAVDQCAIGRTSTRRPADPLLSDERDFLEF